jgi:hypothetical protein
MPNAFTYQKCNLIQSLQFNVPEKIGNLTRSLNSQIKIRGGEVWSLGI